jgi:hypothetical protein
MIAAYQFSNRSLLRRSSATILIFLLGGAAVGQAPKPPAKPTELVIKRYEKFVADGYLLTPEGWRRASALFDRLDAFQQDSEISVISTGGLIEEEWVKGDHAMVGTKWDDYYGTIDSTLRFKSGAYGPVMMGGEFSLRCISAQANDKTSKPADLNCAGDWKIEGPKHFRSATIPAAIRYVAAMRDKAKDPAIRENADKTIAALKHLRRGCGSASAC